jgi:demethylmenaquinone methyltransferase/2-methoxy-6-polyprenyl-1,4-benzoquinol methylase
VSDTKNIEAEQIAYYRARAAEYDEWFLRRGRYDRGAELNATWHEEVAMVRAALDTFRPTGHVLELACGTGLWTEQLVRSATHLTAVDAAPEAIALNRQRVRDERVEYVEADLFTWTPPRARFDVVFFSFWLSHVPPDRFDAFWQKVSDALRPGGRFFLVDSRREPTSTAVDHRLPSESTTTLTRRLNDGREFEIYKIFYEPASFVPRLAALGWTVQACLTPTYFLYATGFRTKDAG